MIDFLERNSESRTIHAFFVSQSTSNDHIYFSRPWYFEYFFNPKSVTSLHGASIVANSCHTDHKVLGCQAGTLMSNDPKVTITNLPVYWPEKPDNLYPQIFYPSEDPKNIKISKWYKFPVIVSCHLTSFHKTRSKFCLFEPGIDKIQVCLCTTSSEILTAHDNN